MSQMEEMLRKSNMIPFGDVTVTNHPNTPPIPMTFPMVYLMPISKDEVTGEAKYKMLIPRTGPEMPPVNFPPFFPLQSPPGPILPGMNQRFPPNSNFQGEENLSSDQNINKKASKSEMIKTPNGKQSTSSSLSLKVETSESENIAAPLDLTHRSPNSSVSDTEEEHGRSKKDLSSKNSNSSSPAADHKLGSDIEEHLQFLKVKQMEFLKQAAESAQNRCNECNINFSKYQNYVAHKKYYCSGLKNAQNQDSDEESPGPATQSTSTSAKNKTPLPSPSSPSFSPPSQNLSMPKQNLFNQDFFLNQKSLLENFPGKMPLLMTPPVMNMPQANTSHFVCQGCGIKFKSLSNLKAHQSRYCSGIKNPEENSPGVSPVNPNLEALLKSQMQQQAQAAGGLPMQGLSAADMISFLSAQHLAAVKNMEEKKTSQSPPTSTTPVRGKSPKLSSEISVPQAADGSKPENKEDFCLVLCGFKESAVDLNKLKEQFNMQFIGQVNKKRKSDSDPDGAANETDDANHSSDPLAETVEEPINKRVKKEDDVGDVSISVKKPTEVDPRVDIKQEAEKEASMKCSNCNISFVNATTFRAHVNFYCKKRDSEQHE